MAAVAAVQFATPFKFQLPPKGSAKPIVGASSNTWFYLYKAVTIRVNCRSCIAYNHQEYPAKCLHAREIVTAPG